MKLIKFNKIILCLLTALFLSVAGNSQGDAQEYKKRVLESAELDFLASYYTQDGDNAAVSGGIGTEKLTDLTSTIVVSIPLNDDDVLSIDAGISAYTSASSGNVNPFQGGKGDPFVASSGESSKDSWINLTTSYTHSSDDRNDILSAKLSFSNEYDYSSIGVGGSYTKLFNEKNTEISIHASAYFDQWSLIYPIELRRPDQGGDDEDHFNINNYTITGNSNYSPNFTALADKKRNSYAAGLGFSQILSKKLQGSLALDVVQQQGLLSTPFQRVYFNDVEDSFIDKFHLADDIERLPDSRLKIAVGGRLNYYINEVVVLRSFYRYYTDDWGIVSQTASLEIPVKISPKFTLYPSYRYYTQTAADYFAPYNQHQSTSDFYTSDYDLSAYNSNQFGFGATYTDIFTKTRIWKFGIKSIDLKFLTYDRDSGLRAFMVSGGIKFILDK
jgi:type II secretory pathway pseudopilin PulG